MNYEKKVKNLYPDAKLFAGFSGGWGIESGNVILAVSRFRTLDEAWRNAWYTASYSEHIDSLQGCRESDRIAEGLNAMGKPTAAHILLSAENARWEQLFAYGMNQGMTESQADHDAWIGLQEEFPRLRKYDGCE